MRKGLARALGMAVGFVAGLAMAAAADLKVVVSIKPVHALVAGVMEGTGAPPVLLVDGAGSPHTFALTPGHARALNSADLVVRVAEPLEPFLNKVLATLPTSVRVLTLAAQPGMTLHRLRTGDTFEEDGHDHAHEHGKAGHAHGGAHDHDAENGVDGHLWLDPENARLIVRSVADALAAARPELAPRFRENAARLEAEVARLDGELAGRLKPFAGRPFVVFHDAYQYFERHYGLAAAGSVSVSPEVPPSAKRIAALRRKIGTLKATCVFAEPQFAPRVIETIVEGTKARHGTLDPLGAALPPGPALYAAMMRGLADGLAGCLGGG